MGRREAEHETETTPADRPQDFPATGRRAVKPRPPLPAGGETPWDGGKQSVKERETETTPACGWGDPVGRREAECEGA